MWNISGSFLWTRDRSDCINPLLNMENAYHSTELNSLWNMQYAMLPMTGGSIFDVFGQLQQNAYNAANAQMQAFLMAMPQWGSGSAGVTPNVGTGLFPSFPGIMPTIPLREKEPSIEPGEDPKAPDNMSEADKEKFNKAIADYNDTFEKFEGLTDDDAKTLGIYNKLNNIKKKYSAADTAEKVRIAIQDLNDLLDPEKGIKEENLKKLLGEKKDILASTAGYENWLTQVYSATTDSATVKSLVVDATADPNKPSSLHAGTILTYDAYRLSIGEPLLIEVLLDKEDPDTSDMFDGKGLESEDLINFKESVTHVVNLLKARAIKQDIKSMGNTNVSACVDELSKALKAYNGDEPDYEANDTEKTALKEAYKNLYRELRLTLADAQDKEAKEALEAKNLPDAIKELYKEDGEWKDFCNINRKAVEEELGV